MELRDQLTQITRERFDLAPEQCSDRQLYEALLTLTRRLAESRPAPEGTRKLYYFSAEFLMGKLLDNNLLALGIHSKVRELLSSMGRDLAQIEEQEPEPSLGNGGLGRRASITTTACSTSASRTTSRWRPPTPGWSRTAG